MFKPTTIHDVKQGSEAWHMFRAGGIGGSESAALLDCHPYMTQHDVLAEKLGRPGFTGNSRTDLGSYLEPYVKQKYVDATGRDVVELACKVHDFCEYMRVSPDGGIIDDDHDGHGVLEVKTVNPWDFKKYKMEGLPEHWIIQLQHGMEVWDLDWGSFAMMDRESGEVVYFDVERDREIGKAILEKIRDWWMRHVIDREPLAFDNGKPADLDLPKVGGDLVTIDTDDWRDAVASLKTARQLRDEAQSLENAAKCRVLELMGTADVVEGHGVRVYHTESQGRKTLDKKALQAAHPEVNLDLFMKYGKAYRVFRPYFTDDGGY